jgi:transposase
MEKQVPPRKPYPSDVSDEEWAFVAPYLALVRAGAPQRRHDLRAGFAALRDLVRPGVPWRTLPGDVPPWPAVSQQARRWLEAGVVAAMGHDLRAMLRRAQGRNAQPSAASFDRATRHSTPESGSRAGYDGDKRRNGSTIHLAVDALGEAPTRLATPADAQDRERVEHLAAAVQEVTGGTVAVGFVDQGYAGEPAAAGAARHGVRLEVVTLEEAKRGFVLLPRRGVVARSFAGAARFRRLAKDHERLPEVLAGLHCLAFLTLMLRRLLTIAGQSP